MIGVLLEVELYLAGRTSLKEKRKTMRSLVDGLAPKFRAAVAEVDAQDAHQRGVLGFALVGADPSEVRQRAEALLGALNKRPDLEVLRVSRAEAAPEAP